MILSTSPFVFGEQPTLHHNMQSEIALAPESQAGGTSALSASIAEALPTGPTVCCFTVSDFQSWVIQVLVRITLDIWADGQFCSTTILPFGSLSCSWIFQLWQIFNDDFIWFLWWGDAAETLWVVAAQGPKVPLGDLWDHHSPCCGNGWFVDSPPICSIFPWKT